MSATQCQKFHTDDINQLYIINPVQSLDSKCKFVQFSGLLIFRGKKSKISWDFQGQIRGKIGQFRGEKVIIRGKNRPISREKSQNLPENRSISRNFSRKKSNIEGFSGANS